jgi:hypothetical protein
VGDPSLVSRSQRAIRTAREVFDDHLRIGVEGTVEDDIARSYASTVVILTGDGVHRGYDGLRDQAARMQRELPNCTFHYRTRLVEGEVAFLEWTAEADGARVRDGVDSYLIRDGRILAQTVHYTIEPST